MRIVITTFDKLCHTYDCESIGIDYTNHTMNLHCIDLFGDRYLYTVPFEKILYSNITEGVNNEKGL